MTRPCANNDTDCGTWSYEIPETSTLHPSARKPLWWFTPYPCYYRDVSPENARKCLGNRTIACIGDSMIRDICQAVVHLLLGLNHSDDVKFDYNEMDLHGMVIPDFPFWSKNVPLHNHNGYIFPKPFDEKYVTPIHHKWQVQMWSLFRREFMAGGQSKDVIAQRMVNESLGIRPIDFLLWNHGFHDYGWFNTLPYGPKYFETIILRDYLRVIPDHAKMPTLWVSMNSNCPSKLRPEDRSRDQDGMVVEANKYANQILLDRKIPYWDADAVLRTPADPNATDPGVCKHSSDGVHVKMYVDTMRAKMLFNHLCDHHWVWNRHPHKHFVNS
jgi:hypothetical protein